MRSNKHYYTNYRREQSGKEKYEELISQKDPEILEEWKKEQEELKKKLIMKDLHDWDLNAHLSSGANSINSTNVNTDNNINSINEEQPNKELKYIAGMDLSHGRGKYENMAVSALIICDKNFKIVYEDYQLIKITEPYVPSFLAFREVKHLVKLIEDLKKKSPQYLPQVILVDGNGILHTRKFGLASHLGVLVDIPTIGCGKTVFAVDGITRRIVEDITYSSLHKKGDSYKLIGKSGFQWGWALKTTNDPDEEPMIISIGHRVSNDTALKVVQKSIKDDRVPEPIRLSDKISRRLIMAFEKFAYRHHYFDLKKYLHDSYDYIHQNL